MRRDGTQLRQITRAPSADPAFAPGGTHIVFSRRTAAAGQHWQLHTVRTDGTESLLYAGDDSSDWTEPTWITAPRATSHQR